MYERDISESEILTCVGTFQDSGESTVQPSVLRVLRDNKSIDIPLVVQKTFWLCQSCLWNIMGTFGDF